MGILWETSATSFIVLNCILASGAAWMSGRALALGWRPFWQVVVYMLLFALAVRFFHFALANGTLLSPWYYLVDAAVVIAVAALAYRFTRAGQMATQYPWLYERAGPFAWRERAKG